VLQVNPETGEKDLIGYRERIKKGETELSRLQVEMEELTQRHKILMISKDPEFLTAKTNYAEQMGALVSEIIDLQSNKVSVNVRCQ